MLIDSRFRIDSGIEYKGTVCALKSALMYWLFLNGFDRIDLSILDSIPL